jgi:integrase
MRNQKANIKVRVRHSVNCRDKGKGPTWQDCACWKSHVIYFGGKQVWQSANTQNWAEAVRTAKEKLAEMEPLAIENKRLKAEAAAKDQRQDVTLEDAVSLYTQDSITRLGDGGTVRNIRSLFGAIDPESKAITRPGHFFTWVRKQSPRPVFVSDITTAHLTSWRNSWSFGSDYTASQYWSGVVGFFAFAVSQGWISQSPARKERMKPLEADKAGRGCAIFSDEQYQSILDSVYLCGLDGNPKENLSNWHHRLEAFVELMRWGGMDLIDACQYRPTQIRDGVLRYHRQKTGELATIPVPESLVVLLRDLPLELDSVGPDMPFRSRNILIGSDIRKWQSRLTQLFKFAEIESVTTAQGKVRKPYSKCFRHTCAVNHLRHHAGLIPVSKYLGHSDPATTATYYLGFVPELEDFVIEQGRKSLAAQIPKPKSGSAVLEMRRK